MAVELESLWTKFDDASQMLDSWSPWWSPNTLHVHHCCLFARPAMAFTSPSAPQANTSTISSVAQI